MVKVKTEKLRPGMVLAEDVPGKGGVTLRSGMNLTERFIGLLTNPALFSQSDVGITSDSYNAIILKFSDELKKEGEAVSLEISDELFRRHAIVRVGESDFKVEGDLE